jgi:hypothetical protein
MVTTVADQCAALRALRDLSRPEATGPSLRSSGFAHACLVLCVGHAWPAPVLNRLDGDGPRSPALAGESVDGTVRLSYVYDYA